MLFLELVFNIPVRRSYTYRSDREVSVGCRVQAELGRRRLTGWVVGCSESPPPGVSGIKSIGKAVDTVPLFGESTLSLARWMSELTLCSLGEALACMLPGGRREGRGLADIEESDEAASIDELTSEQSRAVKAITGNSGGRFYLYGGTGSGKTEVFLRAAEDVMSRGGGVIYLVPEIALSHHLVESLSKRFSGHIAVLHSGLSPSRRLTQWRKIQKGEALFVLGARSAVFAPIENLGMIIIDEEHEGSYKSSSTPRYHARQLAMRRCRISKAALIMGSATPSTEAWALMNSGGLKRLELSGRPAGGAPPEVRVIDMKREKGILSRDMLQALSRVLDEGRQALLFLNRRGFSYHYSCPDCGEEVVCRHCSVLLTFHKNRNAMVCHYCGHRSIPPTACAKCGSLQMRAAGFGTEKIEEEIRSLYPEKRVVRLDSDTARLKGVLSSALRDFRTGKIDILLGTQMVTKGLNAPGVKLAVILAADTTLNLPDFRSAERTFALIVQVAGRVGRFRPDGEVIIQTFRPDSFPVRFAAENKIAEFYEYEIAQRDMLGFPPYSRLFRLVVRGKMENHVKAYADGLAAALSQGGEYWELMGPAECPIGRISDEYRRHLILRSKSFNHTHAAVAAAIGKVRKTGTLRLEIDIDPVALL